MAIIGYNITHRIADV